MTAVAERYVLTVVDEVIHALDHPVAPWSIEVELAFAGHIDEKRLRAAIGVALERHPMARVRLVPSRPFDREYFWQVTPEAELDPLQVLEYSDDAQLTEVRDRLQSIGVPLAESPPFRLRLVHNPDGDRLLLNANHTAFDGFGCLRLLQSVARAYTGDPDPSDTVSLTEARDVRGTLGTDDPTIRIQRGRVLASKTADLARAPARLATDGGTRQPGYLIVHRSLSVADTQVLATAGGPGTVNDKLVAALHIAIWKWNYAHHSPSRRISVLMPLNLRPTQWRDDMVTNFVLMSRTLSARPDHRSPGAVLDAIIAQTERIKDCGRGAALIELLVRSTKLPALLKESVSQLLWLTGNRLVDTALISNLGRLNEPPTFGPEAGETTGLWFSAPARMPCGLSVGAATTAGQLHLSFRCRYPVLDRPAANRFAEDYLAAVSALTEG
ncbi:MAG: condensation domain-containing protein [Acidimicrobiales bacterium]